MDIKSWIDIKTISPVIAASALMVTLIACGHGPTSQAIAGEGDKTAVTTDSSASSTSTPAQPTPLAGGDPQAAIANATQLLTKQTAYRTRSTTVSSSMGGGQTSTDVQEFVAPDRMHNIEEGGKEVIVIGQTMYVKEDGRWRNLGTQMSDMAEKMKERARKMSAEERAEAMKGLTADYKSLADEMLDGRPTAVYEMHSQMDTHMPGVGPIVTITKYWVGKSDGLFRKEETDGEEAGMKIKTTQTYEYDPNIRIEAPIP